MKSYTENRHRHIDLVSIYLSDKNKIMQIFSLHNNMFTLVGQTYKTYVNKNSEAKTTKIM